MTSVVGLILLPTRITLWFSLRSLGLLLKALPLPRSLVNMAGLFDALFRGLTGVDRMSEVEKGQEEVSLNLQFPADILDHKSNMLILADRECGRSSKR